MTCIGLIVYMHCFQPGPVVVSDFCIVAKPLVTAEHYRPSRSDSQRSKKRYAALRTRYNRLCKKKIVPR